MNRYDGAFILVTHDKRLRESVCGQTNYSRFIGDMFSVRKLKNIGNLYTELDKIS